MTNGNDLAHPSHWKEGDNEEKTPIIDATQRGLTKREYFASEFMKSIIQVSSVRRISLLDRIRIFFGMKYKKVDIEHNYQNCSNAAIECADIFINELNK